MWCDLMELLSSFLYTYTAHRAYYHTMTTIFMLILTTRSCFYKLVGWLCLTSHRQRGHLETAPPFTVPCEGRGAR